MATPSPKRQKTSPTSSLPVQAPITPSRIPVPRQDARSTRPSFASPTKASLSRHNPSLLPRRSLSGAVNEASGNERHTLDVPGAERSGGGTQLEEGTLQKSIENVDNDPRPSGRAASQPLESGGVRSVRRSLSAKPRRMSRSPSKSPSKRPDRTTQENRGTFGINSINPFQKKGLRRSPPPGSASEQPSTIDGQNNDTESGSHDVSNPFRKTGLRRSPIASQEPVILAPEPHEELAETGAPEPSTTSPGLKESPAQPQNAQLTPEIRQQVDPVNEGEPAVISSQGEFTGRALRRSPIAPFVPQSSDVIPATQDQMQEGTVVEDVANPSPENSIDATSSPHNATAEGIRASPIEPEISLVTESIEKERTQQPVQELFPEPEPQPETNLEPLPLSDSKAQPAQITPPQQPTNPFLIPRPKTVTPSPAQTLFGPRIVEPAVPAAAYSQEEPELPPTPTQRGLSDPVVTTPPSGIHNTPSKRARRRKSPGAGLKSSPLKPQAQRPEDPIDESVLMPPPPPELKAGNLSKRRRSARFLPPADPNATKRKERDDLLKELQQLKADVSLTNQENERIRKAFESGRSGSSTSKDTQELLDVLLRSMATEAPTLPEPKPISSLPNVQLFLPFSSKRKAQTSNSPVLEKPLPSYLPVPLDDPLPYLQVFAPLSYTSNISILPNMPTSSSSDDSSFLEVPPLQRHHITARSQSGLFAAKLAMTVNMSNLSVASIDIEKLDRNAEAELGAFMRKRLSDRDEDIEYTLGKDITVLCWAMGRWAEVSVLRARLWCAIELELGTPEARKDTIQKASRKRKRKRAVAVDEEVAADLADMADENGHQKWTRRQLLPHMGRTALEISDEAYHVEIRFEWRMDFDWTGEIESIISASARIPKHWQQEDDRRSLTKIPETFNRMVLDMGPLGAARALVGLLMPS